jgi:hypothetical protein
MINKAKAPAAATTGARNTGAPNSDEVSPCLYSVAQTGPEINPGNAAIGDLIFPHLRSGKRNARKKPELLRTTGLNDRAFRKCIETLRRGCVVICSGDYGYFLPATLEEVQGYVLQEESRARSTFFTLQSARWLASEMQGHSEQLTIDGARW